MILGFIFVFLAITFGFSAFEKITDFKGTTAYYATYFSKTFLARYISSVLIFVIVFEVLITFLFALGLVELYLKKIIFLGYWALVLAASLLLCFLVGQRLVKDYDGARGIAIYFIICLLGLVLIELVYQ
ncbi:hypothetical protein [Capnocytophaga sp.]|uniref:hypothetical protein n=1 Tax=Capnocytophaga sp. TaxID=44737 RepID=UPI0026DC5FF7|nr:hypothetical protein [Capnocytophaga sp.]MDO5104630.1 hypothetical protein [Capnocytophaga sp.]